MQQTDLRTRRTSPRLAFTDDMNLFIAGDRMPSSPKGAKMLARAYPALDRPPELERRLRRRLKPTNDSWRADETYIRVKGKWVYLYRAVD